MVAFEAHILPAPVLPERALSSLCPHFIGGYCSKGEYCDRSHDICRVPEKPQALRPTIRIQPPKNILSPEPRLTVQEGTTFDSQGPGYIADAGYRHDNDYLDIRDINILPTTNEILSVRQPYMPYKDFHRPHHMMNGGETAGTSRLLDTLFRQLRYDNTEQLIDVCYHASQMLAYSPYEEIMAADNGFHLTTSKGSRYMLFRNIKFEELMFNDVKGLIIRLSYSCPRFLRGRWMHSSGHFEEGMLAALVGLDNKDQTLSITFFEVHLRESTDAMNPRGGNGLRASIQLSFAQRENQDDIRRILYYQQGILQGRFVLVDFPKALLASFSATLKQIQNQYHKYPLPFAAQIVHSGSSKGVSRIEPPKYARVPGFSFNLNTLRKEDNNGEDLRLTSLDLNQMDSRLDEFQQRLETATTLDRGQALALSQNLSRALTFTQGPPGTGKSYLGVALAKTIVSSLGSSIAKPILAVCMTNHALDSFLEAALKEGIAHIARLGAGSKVEWTKPYTLRELNHKLKLTQLELQNLSRARVRVEALAREGIKWCESLSNADISWYTVRSHLLEKYPSLYQQFKTLEHTDPAPDGHRFARHAGGFGFHCWKCGYDLEALNRLSIEFATYLGVDPSTEDTSRSGTRIIESLLAEIVSRSRDMSAIVTSESSIWSMSPFERTSMVDQWKREIGPQKLVEQLGEIHRRHQAALFDRKIARDCIDVRCLESKQLIGLTTTACAAYWPLLHQLNPKVVICEEAGEVMEAHTLCTLFPSIEHAIFIGDPLQLRPQVAERALSLETTLGRDYRLDESLFERLMFPSEPGILPIAPSQLSVQRRMHPDIADISRATLYPYLIDHDSTFNHATVMGMAQRMYWFDHHQPEDSLDSTFPASKSCSNTFEVEMVAGLVQYLIGGSAYNLQDVAVLTPYNAQLAALTKRLRTTCSVWLSEKDRETLIDDGFITAEEATAGTRIQVDLINMLRIATIDNFQGEEAKIIVMCTVRSNMDDKVGFLRTKNRINVACSRAREGFYIIGNASLMSQVEMWSEIVNVFSSKNALGSCFKTCCSRHPQRIHNIYGPSDFATIKPCQILCGVLLKCGHYCKEKCHPISLHERMKCMEPCEVIHEACGHNCQKLCGDRCGDCMVPLSPIHLPCGHEISFKCNERTDKEIECTHLVESIPLPCGHTVDHICSNKDMVFECRKYCGKTLSCGHDCLGICSLCRNSTSHPPCQSYCDALLQCGHKCGARCHVGSSCPPCEKPCQKSCEHGGCKRQCSMICDPCIKRCGWICDHHGQCDKMCCLPCTRLPCSEPCSKILQCGHLCPSLCGEVCPKICEECTTGRFSEQSKVTLKCGHAFDLQVLDAHSGLSQVYSIDEEGMINGFDLNSSHPLSLPSLNCPTCGGPLIGVRRYAILYKLRDAEDVLDRMVAKFGRKISMWHRKLVAKDDQLRASFAEFCKDISAGPGAAQSNQELVRPRGNWYMDVQSDVYRYRDEVVRPFESDVMDIGSITRFTVFQRPVFAFALRLELLFRRCRLATLREARRMADFLSCQGDPTTNMQYMAEGLQSDIDEQGWRNIHRAATTITECRERQMPALEVEFILTQLSFRGICRDNGEETTFDALASCERALHLCGKFPDTAGKFFRSCKLAKRLVNSSDLAEQISGAEPKDHWKKWGKHITGHLNLCQKGHPYSSATFEGCPECGKEVDSTSGAEPVDYEKYLDKNAFLKAMERKAEASGHVGGSSVQSAG